MKKIYFILLSLFLALPVMASTHWNLQGNMYNVDTLYHANVGPSTTQTTLALSGPVNLRVLYTTTDLSNPNVDLKVVMGNNKLASAVTVPNMPASCGDTKNIYFSGINADMFSYTGTGTIGNSVANEIVYKTFKDSGWFGLAYNRNKEMKIGATSVSFLISGCPSAKSVNTPRSDGNIIIYTSKFGTNTKTSGGTEVITEFVNGSDLKANGTTKVRIKSVVQSGNNVIPENGLVISASGWTTKYFDELPVGSELEITPSFRIDNVEIKDLVEMTGGCPVILKDGQIQNTDALLDHLKSRTSRTAVGYDSTGKKIVMLVVDSRQPGVSEGVPSKDLAAIMANVGCIDALNLDGGGSSTLYHNQLGVRNVPSDGSPRKVINGLFLITPDENDNAIASIGFADYVKRLEQGVAYTPVIYGYNAKGVLVNKDLKGFQLSASYDGVKIDGETMVCSNKVTFALTATYNSMTASIPVYVGYEEEQHEISQLQLEWMNSDVANLHTSARQGFGMNDKFYLQNKDSQKIEVWGSTGKIEEIPSGAGTNLTFDDANNIIVRVGTFNTNYVNTRDEMKIISPDRKTIKTLPLSGIEKGRLDFWGHVSGNVLDAKEGGKLYMAVVSSGSILTEIPIKDGMQDVMKTNAHPYVVVPGLKAATTTALVSAWKDGEIALLNPYNDLTDCNSIEKLVYDEFGSLVHDSYYITPQHNSCSGYYIFEAGGRKYIVYSADDTKADGFAIARLATKDTHVIEITDNNYLEAVKSPMKKADGSFYSGNAFYSNHFSVEKIDDNSVYIYQYCPNAYIAKYKFTVPQASVEDIISDDENRVKVMGKDIIIEGDCNDVTVYNLNGSIISRNENKISVNNGVYLVKISNFVKKVIVR